MYLKDLIDKLEKADKNIVVKKGFCAPHSHRGSYDELAFELCGEQTVGKMLDIVKSCHGKIFEGYKGGEFKMTDYSKCVIANWGESGEEISSLLIDYMIGEI